MVFIRSSSGFWPCGRGDVYGSALAMVAMQQTAVETLQRVHSAAEEAAQQEEERQQEREKRQQEIEDQIKDLEANPPPGPRAQSTTATNTTAALQRTARTSMGHSGVWQELRSSSIERIEGP